MDDYRDRAFWTIDEAVNYIAFGDPLYGEGACLFSGVEYDENCNPLLAWDFPYSENMTNEAHDILYKDLHALYYHNIALHQLGREIQHGGITVADAHDGRAIQREQFCNINTEIGEIWHNNFISDSNDQECSLTVNSRDVKGKWPNSLYTSDNWRLWTLKQVLLWIARHDIGVDALRGHSALSLNSKERQGLGETVAADAERKILNVMCSNLVEIRHQLTWLGLSARCEVTTKEFSVSDAAFVTSEHQIILHNVSEDWCCLLGMAHVNYEQTDDENWLESALSFAKPVVASVSWVDLHSIWFRRADVLKLWPEAGDPPTMQASPPIPTNDSAPPSRAGELVPLIGTPPARKVGNPGHPRKCAIAVIRELWPDGIPAEPFKTIVNKVNDRLRETGRGKVDQSTIRRAIRDIRSQGAFQN